MNLDMINPYQRMGIMDWMLSSISNHPRHMRWGSMLDTQWCSAWCTPRYKPLAGW